MVVAVSVVVAGWWWVCAIDIWVCRFEIGGGDRGEVGW